MTGARLGAQGMADLLFESCVEGDARSRDHEKNKLEVIARRAIHYQAVGEGWQGFQGAVELRRAHAYAASVQDRVGPAQKNDAPLLRPVAVVPVAPGVGVVRAVGVPKPVPRGVIDEAQRLGGEGRPADELACCAVVLVVEIHGHGEPSPLQGSGFHGALGLAQGEAAEQVRTPGDGAEGHVPEALLREGPGPAWERRAGAEQHAERRQGSPFAQLGKAREIGRGGAEVSKAPLPGKAQECVLCPGPLRIWGAVVKADGRAAGQAETSQFHIIQPQVV